MPSTDPKLNIRLTKGPTGFNRFPLNNFKYFLTLFSKFFSSFPHGTCSLSVSHQYLALDEIYHPFRAGVPTRLFESTTYAVSSGSQTGFSPSMMPCSKRLIPMSHTVGTSIDYNSSSSKLPDFQFELFPLHSPLLGESLLVSFPPLNNMLKFGGSSHFISDLISKRIFKLLCLFVSYSPPFKKKGKTKNKQTEKSPKVNHLFYEFLSLF